MPLAFLGRVVLGILLEVAMLSRPLDLLGQINRQFPIELDVARGVIAEAELSDDLLGVLKEQIAYWREQLRERDHSQCTE